MTDSHSEQDRRLTDLLRDAAADRFDAGFEHRVLRRIAAGGWLAESLLSSFRWIAVPAAAACLLLAISNVFLTDMESTTVVEAMFGLPPVIGGLALYL